MCSKYFTIFRYYILHRELWGGLVKSGIAKCLFDLISNKGIKFVFTNRGLVILIYFNIFIFIFFITILYSIAKLNKVKCFYILIT